VVRGVRPVALPLLWCRPRGNGRALPWPAFVHGNWAFATSAGGRYCGVDEEMAILAETGCYADLTLPVPLGLPHVGKINSLYECGLPLDQRAPHRRGPGPPGGGAGPAVSPDRAGPLALDARVGA